MLVCLSFQLANNKGGSEPGVSPGHAPWPPRITHMHVVASTRPGLLLHERRTRHAEHGVVDGTAIDPGDFAHLSINQRKDQIGGSAFRPSNENTLSHVALYSRAIALLSHLRQWVTVGVIRT
jgi:hypothetical protein